MKVVFMGTPEFAVPTLENLINKHEVVAVFTQPDRPKGRGRRLQAPPVKVVAEEHLISVYQPQNIKDVSAIEDLKKLAPDVIVVVAYGQILPKSILELPLYGCINVHASILPKYRGPAPIHWSVINGERKTGITTMYMETGLDTGDILLQENIDISIIDTAGDVHDRLKKIGADLLIKTLKNLEERNLVRLSQNHEEATYAPMLDRDTERIDWKSSAQEIYNKVRGLNPWPGAYTKLGGKILKIWGTEIGKNTDKVEITPGEVLEIKTDGVVVGTGDGEIVITELQPAGKKKMKAAAFLRGYHIQQGEVLGE